METLNTLISINFDLLTVVLLVIFFTAENVLNTQFKFDKMGKHLLENIGFLILITLLNLFWAGIIVAGVDWLNSNQIGLFHYLNMPIWLFLLLSLMLFDMANYWFHRIAHNVSFLWSFHRVHHSDSRMDASSNIRVHPIELVFYFGSSSFLMAAIFGLDTTGLGLYVLVIIPYVFIEHCNLKYPTWIDKTFGLVFTTPNFHRVHHDQDEFYTNSNYADIFILWDRIFGTFKYKHPEEVKLGLKEFDDQKQSFWYLMKTPFINIPRHSDTNQNSK
ncbi:MAG: sterol desaturase family protein [Bacteroidetes bacterium]|nr:sterol desaturase family protein [Bacteroidota bacterium]